jgi:hypothetical protein
MKHKEWAIPQSFLAIACAVLMLAFSVQIFAQAGIDQGSITGTVKDPSGAVVQKAQCTLTNTDTGVSQRTLTTTAGAYAFPFVNGGAYTLTVEAKGFEKYLLTGIVVHVGNTVTEDVSLKIGAVSEQVSVTSAAPLLQAQDASLGMTLDSTAATELPIFGGSGGRSFLALATIAPGVQFTGSNLGVNTNFFANGVSAGQVDVRLNGADDNMEVWGGIVIPPIPDAIQEFKLEDGNNSADLGEFYGPVVNVVTKAGTNKFEGTVWEYNENDMFNANDYFNKLHQLVTNSVHTANRPGRYKENSFGGVFGGPVILPHFNGHNRTFFTVDYQHTIYTQDVLYTQTVPTNLMQSSGFTNLADTLTLGYQAAGGTGNPLSSMKPDGLGRNFQVGMMLDPATTRAVPCGGVDPITGLTAGCAAGYTQTINGVKSTIVRDPFLSTSGSCPTLAGTLIFNSVYNTGNGSQPTSPASCFNQLPASRLDPNAVALLKLFPAPNQQNSSSLTYSNNYYIPVPQPTITTQYDVRIDHKVSDKDSLFGTFSHYVQTSPGAAPFNSILEGGTSGSNFNSNNPSRMIVIAETHVFNPGLINEFKFGFSEEKSLRQDYGGYDFVPGIPAQYGIQGIPQTGGFGLGNGGLPDIGIGSSITTVGSRSNITTQSDGSWSYSDNLTKIKGRHEWKFGGQWLWTFGNIAQLPSSRGSFSSNGTYSNVPNSGDGNGGMADFLLLPGGNVANSTYAAAGGLSTSTNEIGGLASFSGNNYNYSTYHAPYLSYYATDSWKVTPKFTATLGIRYEYIGAYRSDGGQEANLWMGGTGDDPGGTAFYIGADGCATTTSANFKGLLASDNIPIICEPNNTVNKTPKANWSPRIGLAYRITPRIVARMGGGVAYGGFGSVGYGGTLGTNYPFRFTAQNGGSNNAYTPQLIGTTGTGGAAVTTATMENTFAVINLNNPLSAYQPLGSVALYGKQYHFHEPHVTTLTAAVQWQFTNHDSIQATYVGNLGRDLESANPYNNAPRETLPPSVSAVTACTAAQLAANPYCENSPLMPDGTTTIPFPNLKTLTGPMENTEQVSNYQAGEAEYQHQFAAGFNMDANYTFAHCLSDAQGGQQGEGGPGNGRAPWIPQFGGYRADYDRCTSFANNVFKLSGEYGLPFGRGAHWASHANGVEDALIGGWKIDPIWIASSGFLANLSCQGTNGQGANPTFTGPWFQTSNTAWACNAPKVSGVNAYGPGSKDLPRTRSTGYWNSSAWTAPQIAVQTTGQLDFTPFGVRGNQIYGPGWYDVDTSIHKQFKIYEDMKLEIQAQVLNAFNHAQLNNPGTSNYTSPSGESLTGGFGTITSTHLNNGEGRIWQFAGKFFF